MQKSSKTLNNSSFTRHYCTFLKKLLFWGFQRAYTLDLAISTKPRSIEQWKWQKVGNSNLLRHSKAHPPRSFPLYVVLPECMRKERKWNFCFPLSLSRGNRREHVKRNIWRNWCPWKFPITGDFNDVSPFNAKYSIISLKIYVWGISSLKFQNCLIACLKMIIGGKRGSEKKRKEFLFS